MIRVALWICALFTVANTRIYDRCELARTLQDLGVSQEHISTWVCIAYHESRFDTAAYNSYSGDHGIFQISQLYWCGGGKACGLSCDSLRDDNIADDLQCALRVHEEHTRLQGDGFQAWVVYPQHCKGNTKKYLADCSLRSGFSRPMGETYSFTAFDGFQSRNDDNNNIPNIDNLLPPYLAISSIFSNRYGKVLDHMKNVDWFHYKYDKIDELKLPDLNIKVNDEGEVKLPEIVIKVDKITPLPDISTTTIAPTTTPARLNVTRKYIETNQFRKKITGPTTAKPIVIGFAKNTIEPGQNSFDIKLTTKQEKFAFDKSTATLTRPPATELSTHKSTTTVTLDNNISPKVSTTLNIPQTSIKTINKTNIAYKLPAFTTSYNISTTSSSIASPYKFSTPSWRQRFTTTTPKPIVPKTLPFFRTTTIVKPTTLAPVKVTVQSLYTFPSRHTRLPTTTVKYSQVNMTKSTSTTQIHPLSSTSRPARTSRSTQSLWDLYLNPTKPPQYEPLNFSWINSKYKLNIFSDGTTTVGPSSRKNTGI